MATTEEARAELIAEVRKVSDAMGLPMMRILAFICVSAIHRKAVARDYHGALEDAVILVEALTALAKGSVTNGV